MVVVYLFVVYCQTHLLLAFSGLQFCLLLKDFFLVFHVFPLVLVVLLDSFLVFLYHVLVLVEFLADSPLLPFAFVLVHCFQYLHLYYLNFVLYLVVVVLAVVVLYQNHLILAMYLLVAVLAVVVLY